MTLWSTRTWLITGASAGLGKSMVAEIAKRGGRVIAGTRDPASLSGLAGRYDGRILPIALDVTSPSSIAAAMQLAAAHGGADVLVNNAGYGFLGGVEESSDDEIRKMFEVNLFGAAAMMRAVLPGMRARRAGYIINISSIAGIYGGGAGGYYSATKFGLEGLSESMAREGKTLGINVLIVTPGAFRTGFFGRSLVLPKNHIPEYEAVAQTHAYAAAGDGNQPGDPDRAAAIIADTIEGPKPPMRLMLGLESHQVITGSLKARLEEAEAQRELSLQACYPESLPQ